jgi:hypothetical protein
MILTAIAVFTFDDRLFRRNHDLSAEKYEQSDLRDCWAYQLELQHHCICRVFWFRGSEIYDADDPDALC